MSKFKVKGTLDGVTKSVELERGRDLDLNSVKIQLERAFGERDLTLKYKGSDGRTEPLYQTFHLEAALHDAEKSGARFIALQLSGSGKSQPSTTTQAAAATVSPRDRGNSTGVSRQASSTSIGAAPSSPVASAPSSSKFCESCGTPLTPSAKFCSSCGTPSVPSSAQSPAPSVSSPDACGACGKSVNSGLKALDRIWHKECFNCKKCRKSLLETGFVQDEDGSPLCSGCYDTQFGKKCAKCRNPISGVFLNVDGKDYHKECFVCSNCRGPFDGGYFIKDDKPLCKNCV